MNNILKSGFSRIPVHSFNNRGLIQGYILTKDLIVINPLEKRPISDMKIREPLFVRPTTGLLPMLKLFRLSRCHIALVSNNPLASLICMRSKSPYLGDASIIGKYTLYIYIINI